jgi:hypothetical protein
MPAVLWAHWGANPYSSLIYKIYQSLTNVYGFYSAYVSNLVHNNELDLWGTVGSEIDFSLMELAASKLDIEEEGLAIKFPDLATKFPEFRYRIKEDYGKWLNVVKETAYRAGVPLRAELLDMVHRSDEELGNKADSESLGFNSSRLHPDIYMNELLQGMRVIHQVLPAIMKKLGIEFKLDKSELQTGPE